MNNNKKRIIKIIIISAILVLLPFIIGIPFTIGYNRPVILEVVLALFGLVELLVFMILIQLKQRKLYKEDLTNSEFKATDGYKKYNIAKIIILSTAAANLFNSLIYFYFFVK